MGKRQPLILKCRAPTSKCPCRNVTQAARKISHGAGKIVRRGSCVFARSFAICCPEFRNRAAYFLSINRRSLSLCRVLPCSRLPYCGAFRTQLVFRTHSVPKLAPTLQLQRNLARSTSNCVSAAVWALILAPNTAPNLMPKSAPNSMRIRHRIQHQTWRQMRRRSRH